MTTVYCGAHLGHLSSVLPIWYSFQLIESYPPLNWIWRKSIIKKLPTLKLLNQNVGTIWWNWSSSGSSLNKVVPIWSARKKTFSLSGPETFSSEHDYLFNVGWQLAWWSMCQVKSLFYNSFSAFVVHCHCRHCGWSMPVDKAISSPFGPNKTPYLD